MVSFKETVIVFNGPMLGFTKSMLHYCEQLRRELLQPKIKIFIQTWDYDNNVQYLSELRNYVKDHSLLRVEIDDIAEPYTSPQLLKACRKLNTGIGYKSKDIPAALGKRMWFFYSLVKVLKRVKHYNPDAFVMRFEPNTAWNRETTFSIPLWLTTGALRTPIAHQNGHGELRRNILPRGAETPISDMFYTNYLYDSAVGERYFWSSIKTLEKIFSENFHLDNFIDKYILGFRSFIDDYKSDLAMKNKHEADSILFYYDVVPHEAAQYLYRFIKDSETYIPIHATSSAFSALFRDRREFSNSWHDITAKNKLVVTSPWIMEKEKELIWKDQLILLKSTI